LAMQAAVTTHSKRRIAFAVGTILTIAWLLLLRWAPQLLLQPFIFWGLLGVTVGGVAVVERRLSYFTYKVFVREIASVNQPITSPQVR
jgi:hypothetical protein